MARNMRAAPSNVPDDLKWLEAVCAAVPPSHVPASNHVVLTFPSNQWELDPKQLAPIRKHPIYVEQRYDGLKVGAQTETGEEMDWDWEEQELNVMMAETWPHVPKDLQDDVKAFSQSVRERLDALTLELVNVVKDDFAEQKDEPVPADEGRCYVLSAAEKRTLKDSLVAKFGRKIASANAQVFEKDKKEPLPEAARAAMQAEYAREMYPSTAWKQALAEKYSLTKRQVNDWFNNERKRRPHAGGGESKVAAARPRRAPRRGPRVSLAESEDDISG